MTGQLIGNLKKISILVFSIFLNVLFPGVGLIFIHRFRTALVVMVIFYASHILLTNNYGFYAHIFVATTYISLLLLTVGLVIYDAKNGKIFHLNKKRIWSKWYLCIVWLVFGSILLSFIKTIDRNVFLVNDSGHLPILVPNDRVLAVRSTTFTRGDLVFFEENKQSNLGRIIGLPGEKIKITSARELSINDTKCERIVIDNPNYLESYYENSGDTVNKGKTVQYKCLNQFLPSFYLGSEKCASLDGDKELVLAEKQYLILNDNWCNSVLYFNFTPKQEANIHYKVLGVLFNTTSDLFNSRLFIKL